MLFLMNNHVLRLDEENTPPALLQRRFTALNLDYVSHLGAELFAQQPVLPVTAPARAKRLAQLIRSKAPQINAALFVVPKLGAKPEQVAVRYAEVDFATMALLLDRQTSGILSTVEADRLVWRRLAA